MIRHCQTCGAEIPSDGLGIIEYAARKYCSKACSARAPRVRPASLPETIAGHNCQTCGRPLHRRGATWQSFLARQFCSNTCRAHYTEDPTRCDCGAPVTQHVWVVQLSADGWAHAARLNLCDACAALVPEGTPEPPAIPDNEHLFREPARKRVSRTEFEDHAWHQVRLAGGLRIR